MRGLLWLWLLLLPCLSQAQQLFMQPPSPDPWEMWVMQHLPWVESQAALDQGTSRLQQPLNLNQATYTDLVQLGIADSIVLGILRHRAQYGGFLSTYELVLVPGVDPVEARKLYPMLYIGPATPLLGVGKLGQILVQQRLGVSNSSWQYGQPLSLTTRLRASTTTGHTMGLVLQQDAGESFRLNRNQWGVDFLSGYVSVALSPRVQVLIGDYALGQGQQLLLGSGITLARGAGTLGMVAPLKAGLQPYHSTAESGFLRGIATNIQLPRHWTFSTWISHQLRDGGLDSAVGWLSNSGLHVTPGQLAGRASVAETIGGASLMKRVQDPLGQELGQWGIAWQGFAYSAPIQNRYEPNQAAQNKGQAISLWGSRKLVNWHLAGEVVVSESDWASSAEARKALSRYKTFSIKARWLGNGYYAPYAAPNTATGQTNGERGICIGMSGGRQWQYRFWLDGWQTTTMRYRLSAPGTYGWEYAARLATGPIWAQVRGTSKMRDLPNTNGTYLDHYWRQQLELGGKVNWIGGLRSKHSLFVVAGRLPALEGLVLAPVWSSSWCLANEAHAHITRQWQVAGLVQLYQVPLADLRPYLTEPQVMWYQSLPYLHGTGTRAGLVITHNAPNGLLSQLKFTASNGGSWQWLAQLTYRWQKREDLQGAHLW